MGRFMCIMLVIMSLSACVLVEESPVQTEIPTATELVNATETISPIAVTHTPTLTEIVTATSTSTPIPEATSTATFTPSPIPVIYYLQEGSPAYISNFAHPEKGCNWLGVAGQVFDLNSEPVINIVVNVQGQLGGRNLDEIAITGIPEADIYGPGGYEIQLADQVLPSSGTLVIQIFGLDGVPLSQPIPFNTYNDCSKNLIIINFIEE